MSIPNPGSDRQFARTYFLENTGTNEACQTTVEFAAGRVTPANATRASKILEPYLARDTRPPRRLIVSREDQVSERDS